MLPKNKAEIIKIKAPARICLFGDHQDYLGLPVIACAINKYIRLNAEPNIDNVLRINLPDIDEHRVIDLKLPIVPTAERDYFVSALNMLHRIGIIPINGFDIKISGDIPINAGLSSSSAIVVIWITFLLEAYNTDIKVSSELIAELAYKAEVLEYDSPGGLMDQYSISLGGLLFLNTVDGSYQRIGRDVQSLIIGESGVPKQTLGILSELRGLAQRSISLVRSEVSDFKIEKATLKDYELYKDLIPNGLKPIFYAAIKNYEITKEAFFILSQDLPDLKKIGSLMTEHHLILKDILKITVPIIDSMINSALLNGALGAKIVGSGGGGSIVALTTHDNATKVIQGMLDAGATAAYKVEIVNGVTII